MPKSRSEKEREWAEAQKREWEDFLPKLAALKSFEDAKLLVNQAPRPDSAGRKYYSNLGFFLQAFSVPRGSNQTERLHYIQFIQRLDEAGMLKLNAAEDIIKNLRNSLDEHLHT